MNESWDEMWARNSQQKHEIQLKEMEIQSQKDNLLAISSLVLLVLSIAVIICVYLKSLRKDNNKVNQIEENDSKTILANKLNKLKDLFDEGLLTEEEYNLKRSKLIEEFEI